MHTVAHENSFEGSDKECLTEHMYALDRPGERGEVAADESAQHQMPLVCHQRLVIRMAYVAAHARVVHPPVVPRKRRNLSSFPGVPQQPTTHLCQCLSLSQNLKNIKQKKN
jgi:hypothetical protein